MDNTTDYNSLLLLSRAGDTRAREQLFSALQVRLRTILKYRLRGWSEEELDDVLQDTLLVVVEKLDQVESNPDYFALNVLRNKIGNRIIRHRRHLQVSLDPTGSNDEREEEGSVIDALASPDDNVAVLESDATAEVIRCAIGRLSPLCQALFTALLENLSVAETWDLFHATQQNLQRSAFDKRLFDCRRKLRRLTARSL
jgi:RNA polymerase sigma factor (sigma-70 family)